MKKLVLMLIAAVAFAQTPAPAPRVVNVQNGNATGIFDNLSKLFPGTLTRVNQQIVVTGETAQMDVIEGLIQRLDVPRQPVELAPNYNVELTIWVLRGSATQGQGDPVPAELDATMRQLRSVFPYKTYGLIDTQLLRVTDGRPVETSSDIAGTTFQYKVQPSVKPGKAPRMIHLGRFEVSVRNLVVIDGKTQYLPTGIITEIDAQEGQKTVVGKSNFGQDALVVVVTPKVIE